MRRDVADTLLQFGGTDADMVRMVRAYDPLSLVWAAVDAQRKLPRAIAVVHNHRRAV